jgi:hypothetical protein
LGTSWAVLSGASGLPTATQTNYSAGAVSGDGRIIAVAANGGYLYTSNNGTFTNTNPNVSALYAYLPFEGNANDASGNGRNPTVTGSPSYVTGIVGSNAVNLANTAGGTATRYIRGTWVNSTAFGISLWFNLQSLSGGWQNIFVSYSTAWSISMFGSNLQLWNNGVNILTTSYVLTTNVWYNVFVSFQTNGIGYFYLNNILIGSYSCGATAGTYSGIYCLGTNDINENNAFNGYIDDFKIYNTAITFTPMVPANYNNVALSNSGQYMLATVANGGLFMSSNSGSTWSQVTSELLAANWLSLAISATGQYMLAYSAPVVVQPQLTGLASNSWQVNGVSWTVSASSLNGGGNLAYYAFNNQASNANCWASDSNYNSGTYTGSLSTYVNGSGSVRGEWLQIQSSVPIQMYSYTFTSNADGQYPNGLTIAGSNDGVNWYLLQSVIMSGNPATGTARTSTSYIIINQSGAQTMTTTGGSATFTCTTSVYSTNAYMYFRFIAPAVFGSGVQVVALAQWYIRFNAGGQAYSTNFGSTWQNGYALATPSALSLSGSGQYAIGANAPQLISELNFENNYTDSTGLSYLSNPTTVTGTNALTFSSSIYKVGAYSLFVNNNGQANFSYENYTLSSFFNGPTALSISVWIYPTIIPSDQAVIYGFNSPAGTAGPYLYVTTGGAWGFAMYSSGGSNYVQSSTVLSINNWYNIVVTISSGIYTLYINGTYQTYGTYTGTLSLSGGAVPTRFTVGNLFSNQPFAIGYSGYIDDLRMYNTALSLVQINTLYTTHTIAALSPAVYTVSNYLAGFSNNAYSSSTFSPILNASTNIPVASAVSTTGQYMAIITNGTTNVYYSTNYGSTFTGLTIGSTAMTTCAISADGSYITVSNGTTVYQLNNNSNGFSLALGNKAGQQNQGQNAIAIGNFAGQINQSANSIVLNASGSVINPCMQGFYVAPIAQYTASSSTTFGLLAYGTDNQVVQFGSMTQSNVILGYGAGLNNTGGANTLIGFQAGYSNTTGLQNTFIGHQAGFNNQNNFNTFIGTQAGFNNQSIYNIFIGTQTGYNNISGTSNTIIGHQAGYNNTSGGANTLFGYNAGFNNRTGANNTFFGYNAGFSNTTGSSNTFIGLSAAQSNTTGSNNICIGQSAGQFPVTLTTGNDNIYIGVNAAGSASGNSNEIVIGMGATGNGTNTITLGNSSTSHTITNGKVTINTSLSEVLNLGSNYNTSNGGQVIFIRAGNQPNQSALLMYAVNYNNTVVRGTITSTSDSTTVYTSGSDRRIKNSIRELPDIRSLVEKLHPCGFKFNCVPNGPEHVGFIAQEVREHYPHLVVGDESTTTLQLDYGTFSPYAVGGVLDLYKITDSIIAKNTLLETTVKQQATEITALQSQLAQVLQRLSAAGIA